MKFTMDEAMKHRVVGIAVIVSIALVFLPAMIKKNNQRLEEKKIAVELPAKPPQPQMVEVNEPKVFAETKVAHVDLDTQHVLSETEEQINQHPISEPKSIQKYAQVSSPIGHEKIIAKAKDVVHPIQKKEDQTIKPKVAKKTVKKTIVSAKKKVHNVHAKASSSLTYAIQVGVFSERTNAQTFQKELGKKGYRSRLVKTSIHGKPAVKVLIGNLASADAAQQLKSKLASEKNIKGFVTKGVG